MEFVNKLVNKEVAIEFGKEMGRIAFMAALPVLIASLEAGKVDLKIIALAGAVAVLRSIDRALHESGIAKKGITRF